MKNKYLFLFAIVVYIGNNVYTQQLPIGYITQFREDFSKPAAAINEFEFSDSSAWKIGREGKNYFLHFSGKSMSDTSKKVCSQNMAILNGYFFSDFILEANIKISVKNIIPGNNICFFLGLRDTTHYYDVQLGLIPGDSTEQIFVVNNGIKRNLSIKKNGEINWKTGRWHKIKIIRNILAKTITVYFDNMNVPLLEARDRTLIKGYTGFGSSGIPLSIDNIKIWAPTSIEERTELFK
jgi:hypothetical protein